MNFIWFVQLMWRNLMLKRMQKYHRYGRKNRWSDVHLAVDCRSCSQLWAYYWILTRRYLLMMPVGVIQCKQGRADKAGKHLSCSIPKIGKMVYQWAHWLASRRTLDKQSAWYLLVLKWQKILEYSMASHGHELPRNPGFGHRVQVNPATASNLRFVVCSHFFDLKSVDSLMMLIAHKGMSLLTWAASFSVRNHDLVAAKLAAHMRSSCAFLDTTFISPMFSQTRYSFTGNRLGCQRTHAQACMPSNNISPELGPTFFPEWLVTS